MPQRPRAQPLRSCVVCRESLPKRQLTRVVRTADDQVVVDLTGKRPGRGAYLCERPECRTGPAVRKQLGRALKFSGEVAEITGLSPH